MKSFLKRLFNNNIDQDSSLTDQLTQHIDSLIDSIKKSEKSLIEIKQNKHELNDKIVKLSNDAINLYKKAEQALKVNDERTAENLLEEKVLVEQQLKGFKKIFSEVNSTIYSIERDINQNELKVQELKNKKSLITTRLVNAQNNIQFEQQLQSLNTDFGIDDLEEEVLQNEAKAGALKDLYNSACDLDKKLEDIELKHANSLEQVQNQIDEREKEKQTLREQQFQSLFDYMFDNTESVDIQNETNIQKQNILNDFMSAKSKENDVINDFFKDDDKDDKQSMIDDFFNN